MSLHLVTGHAGSAHVNSDMVGRFNAGIIGHDAYILDTQNGLTATIDSANAVTIATGDAIVQGRHVTNESPETLTIQSGGQGVSRYDLIVIRYTNSGGIENAALTVITGTPSANPVDPSYNDDSILDGETTVDIPLYRVVIDGLNIDHIDTLANTISDSLASVSQSANRLSHVGDYVHQDLSPTEVNLPNATTTLVGSRSFAAGTWVITGGFYVTNGAAGIRICYMGTNQNGIEEREATNKVYLTAAPARMMMTRVMKFTSTTTVYFNLWQNSGATLKGSVSCTAVRVL